MLNPQEEILKSGNNNQLIQLLYFKLEVLKMAEGIWKDENVRIEDIPRTIPSIYNTLMGTMECATNPKTIAPPQKNVLTFEELCEYIGMSKSYVYKLTSSGQIPHYKPLGKHMFFKKDEIDNWLLSNPVIPKVKNIIKINMPITGPDGENLGEINQTIEK